MGEEVISAQDLKCIFSEIEVIQRTNSTMLADLEAPNGPQKIGDIFLVMVKYFIFFLKIS